jgi:hypothetical protein
MAQGDYLIEFWPRFASATSVRVPYLKRVYDLTTTDVPIIRADVIEQLALYYCYNHLYGRFGDKRWKELADTAHGKYTELLTEAIREDYDKHALPRSVQVQYPWLGDWGFYVSHDV